MREYAPTLYLEQLLAHVGADSFTQTNTTLHGEPKHSTSKPAKSILAEAGNAKRLRLLDFELLRPRLDGTVNMEDTLHQSKKAETLALQGNPGQAQLPERGQDQRH